MQRQHVVQPCEVGIAIGGVRRDGLRSGLEGNRQTLLASQVFRQQEEDGLAIEGEHRDQRDLVISVEHRIRGVRVGVRRPQHGGSVWHGQDFFRARPAHRLAHH